MKQKLKEQILPSLETESIKDIRDSKDFYFQKAIDKYNDFMALPKLGEELTNQLIDKVNELRAENNFNFMKFLQSFAEDSIEYKVLFCLGELIAYIDYQAANKNVFNLYEDKRTVAKSYVRQNLWTLNLLRYKHSENIEDLVGTIKNSVKYLLNPRDCINILSERHRQLIGLLLFSDASITNNFDEFINKEFSELNIEVANEMNRTLVYERLIYSDNVRPIWEVEKTIWKISHGAISKFADNAREEYLKQQIAVVAESTAKSQCS
jgi:hypothetical protein